MPTISRITRTFAAILCITALAACGQAPGSAATPAATAVATGSAAAPSGGAATKVTVKDFTLDPKDVVRQGQVSLDVMNQGPTIHNITIRDASGAVLGATADLKTGQSALLTATLQAGTYVLYCSLPGHESLGIKGTLVVQP